MARPRHPKRDECKKIYIKKRGKITTRALAEFAGVSQSKIRSWKSDDKWDEELARTPKRGAPEGNRNSVGHGGMESNRRAEIHGAYSEPNNALIPDEVRREIEEKRESFELGLRSELEKLFRKEADLEARIGFLLESGEDELYVSSETVSSGAKDGEWNEIGKSVTSVTGFARLKILEDQLGRVQGRIQKLLTLCNSRETEKMRLDLEERKLKLARERAMGIFECDSETDDDEE